MLADLAYWVTQDEYTGALRTSRRAAGVIVAAAMLAELISQDAIAVGQSRVLVTQPRRAAPDEPAVWMAAGIRHVWSGRAPVRPRDLRELTRPSRSDPLGIEVLAQLVQEPGLAPTEVIGGLAGDIRARVARRLILAGQADRRRRRWWRRELVAVAKDHDVRPAWVSTGPVIKIVRDERLTGDELFLMQLVAHSSLGDLAFAGIARSRISEVLGPLDAVAGPYRALLAFAVAALRDLALAR